MASQSFPYAIFAAPDKVVPIPTGQQQHRSLPEQEEKLLKELQAMCLEDKRGECDRSPFLEHNEARVREIGEELLKAGGTALMERIALRIENSGDRRELEYAWDEIGDWRA